MSGDVAQNGEIVIRRGGPERIPDLQPLWESLHQHHAAVAPHLQAIGPVRAPQQSWQVRRALYEEWLAEPEAFVLVAEDDSRPVAYALVHMGGPEETWTTGDRVAELETLTVLPEYRSHGLGMRLMAAVHGELRQRGVGQMAVGVIATNDDAIRFYERLDLHPFVVVYIGNVPAEPR